MSATSSVPYLSEEALSDLAISTDDVIDSIERLIRGNDKGTVWSAPKAVILPPDNRYMMAALAAMDDPSLLAVKTVVLNPRNPDNGLPQINGLVTMLDSETGLPVAIMDGNWITAVRTAGLSATAARYMANKTASSVGFVGTGVQAKSHLQAFMDMFPLERIKVFGRGQPNIDSLCEMANGLGLTSEVCSSGNDAISGVDLAVTSITPTGNTDPFLDASCMSPGCFVAGTDLGVPWIKESFAELDCLVIDDLAQEAALPNKLADPAHVTGDLSGLVLGKFEGRSNEGDRTAFIFRGHALGDLALASLAYQKFRESGG